LRRGISELIGGAFEWLFYPKGREFEQANLQKFKCVVPENIHTLTTEGISLRTPLLPGFSVF